MQTIIEHIEEVAGNLIKKLELAFSSDVKALEARVSALEAYFVNAKPAKPAKPVVVAPEPIKPAEPETK
jgi:hypothetical protein